MAQKERYVCKKISKDCLFPEILCELKDTESKFFVVLESKDDAVKIADLLNHQDKRIKELEEENKVLEGENKVGEFWHSAYKCKQLEYDMVYAELRGIYEKNQQLKEQLEEKDKQIFELMSKLDLKENEPVYCSLADRDCEALGNVKDLEKQFKQSQKQLAIEELEKVKNYFCEEDEDDDGIKTGDWTITHDACEVAEFIEEQLKELKKGEDKK